MAEGYEIFVVKGDLPIPQRSLGPANNWVVVSGGSAQSNSRDDLDLESAIRASLE